MKTTIIKPFLYLIILVLGVVQLQAQDTEPAWQFRYELLTPNGMADSMPVKEVFLVIDTLQCPGLHTIENRIGSQEGWQDIFYSELEVSKALLSQEISLTPEGWLKLFLGRFTIQADAFFIETRLLNHSLNPLN
jgi:hypothetical protein